MVLKTFNLEEGVYKKFSEFCRENGISMSKQVNLFIKAQMEPEPKLKQAYLNRIDKLMRGRFIKVKDLDEIL